MTRYSHPTVSYSTKPMFSYFKSTFVGGGNIPFTRQWRDVTKGKIANLSDQIRNIRFRDQNVSLWESSY